MGAQCRRWRAPAFTAHGSPAIPSFDNADAADRWLAAERGTIDAALRRFAASHPAHAAAIMAACHQFFHHGHGDQGLSLSRAVLAGAVQAGDPVFQGWALLGLAAFQRGTGHLRAARSSAVHALMLFEQAGDPVGETEARYHLGWLRYLTGDNDGGAATRQLRQALSIYQRLGSPNAARAALSLRDDGRA